MSKRPLKRVTPDSAPAGSKGGGVAGDMSFSGETEGEQVHWFGPLERPKQYLVNLGLINADSASYRPLDAQVREGFSQLEDKLQDAIESSIAKIVREAESAGSVRTQYWASRDEVEIIYHEVRETALSAVWTLENELDRELVKQAVWPALNEFEISANDRFDEFLKRLDGIFTASRLHSELIREDKLALLEERFGQEVSEFVRLLFPELAAEATAPPKVAAKPENERATAKWPAGRVTGETPPQFIQRVYGDPPKISKAGLRQSDRGLYQSYATWVARHPGDAVEFLDREPSSNSAWVERVNSGDPEAIAEVREMRRKLRALERGGQSR